MGRITIKNKTQFPEKPMRAILRACLKYHDIVGDVVLNVRYRPRMRSWYRYTYFTGRAFTVSLRQQETSIDKGVFADIVGRAIGGAAHINLNDPETEIWFDPIADKVDDLTIPVDSRSFSEKIQSRVDRRAANAQKNVELTLKKLAQLETSKKRLKTILKKWQKKVKYYQSREAQKEVERGFLNRVKAKAQAMKEND